MRGPWPAVTEGPISPTDQLCGLARRSTSLIGVGRPAASRGVYSPLVDVVFYTIWHTLFKGYLPLKRHVILKGFCPLNGTWTDPPRDPETRPTRRHTAYTKRRPDIEKGDYLPSTTGVRSRAQLTCQHSFPQNSYALMDND